jgi:hypothetical protein
MKSKQEKNINLKNPHVSKCKRVDDKNIRGCAWGLWKNKTHTN